MYGRIQCLYKKKAWKAIESNISKLYVSFGSNFIFDRGEIKRLFSDKIKVQIGEGRVKTVIQHRLCKLILQSEKKEGIILYFSEHRLSVHIL
jgi:hypothetical protein